MRVARSFAVLCAVAGWLALVAAPAPAADWPQYMRNAAHTGDADDEQLRLPLGIEGQVPLEDAVLTSAAVVGGRAYVVDQMGTAYCLDPRAGKVVWKSSPDGARAMGSNTSSPCVVKGRVYFGTTAGTFHILRADDGAIVKTLNIGSPIISAPTSANGSVYFQALDAVLRCHDLDGNERWTWDHYVRYQEPPEVTKAKGVMRSHPGSYDRPHYAGGDMAVAGKTVVTSFGWDLVALEDDESGPRLRWCNRSPNGMNGTAPMSPSIAGDWVYFTGMGADGVHALTRVSLNDGTVAKTKGLPLGAYAWNTPAVRGDLVATRMSWDGKNGVMLFDTAEGKVSAGWRDEKSTAPIASSQALTRNHLLATTLAGELIVLDLQDKTGSKALRIPTPRGKGISAPPVVADGRVYFGADDGVFYVLGPGGKEPAPVKQAKPVHEPRGTARGAGPTWPSTYGNPGNTLFVDDPSLQPPLRVRWASRGYGHFLAPCVATDKDLITISLTGLVTCQEQATGRMRWRRQMPGADALNSTGMLAHEGRLYVPRPNPNRMEGAFYCLDLRDGQTLWSADIGGRFIWERSAPVLAQGKVAFGSGHKGDPPTARVLAWDAETGKPAWEVELNVRADRAGAIAGCTDGAVMYFTAGPNFWQLKKEETKKGETVAIDARTGKVAWRSGEVFGAWYPALSDQRLFLNFEGLFCVAAEDGKLLWNRKTGYTRSSIGDDFLVLRGYGGHGEKVRLADGKDYPNCRELGGETHSCSPVSLTKRYSFATTAGGLNIRDVKTGELLWRSPGFAPRGCVNPTLAAGRVFWNSAASGMIYCWEPVARGSDGPEGGRREN